MLEESVRGLARFLPKIVGMGAIDRLLRFDKEERPPQSVSCFPAGPAESSTGEARADHTR
jgi:hypothetical protein